VSVVLWRQHWPISSKLELWKTDDAKAGLTGHTARGAALQLCVVV
jgi:hypothetical protein